ncbi:MULTISPECIES: hypothetical protein [Vibrio]|uniref:hypothetical protein n=1 Tax=Vibrio TaxID=662 RepID=UPI0006984528|nr:MULTISPECIES: hypothetical protein [Vibrio]EJG0767276.1 hypothetical protein [Vibrio parahaemolyticus O5:K30]MCA2471790.1 hypothetical protein [Vibrio alginolyticus]MCS0328074.1 hypothetical protein [Vibrio diabolicus]TVM95352.1 hypothetical protein FPV63_24655 [Vibrio cholerae]ARN69949.1 hypothetical protein FORC36_5432 [Vibrio vulnificus]
MKILKTLTLSLSLVFASNALSANVDDDKILHFGASTAIGFASQSFFEDKDSGFYTCAAVGVAKELYDEVDYGGFDTNDMVMNLVGCAVGTVIGDELGFKIGMSKIGDANMLSINYSF